MAPSRQCPRVKVVSELYCFRCCWQRAAESNDLLVSALRDLISKCVFKDRTD